MRHPGGNVWEATTRIDRSKVIDGEPDRVWSLLSSTEGWSIRPRAAFMFRVPDTDRLRLYIGTTPRGTRAVLFEICEQVPGTMVRLRTLPTGRQEFTLSVEPGKHGGAKASIHVKEIVPRQQRIEFEKLRHDEIKGWLAALRAVIEGRAPWPSTEMPADLLRACLARPQISDPQSASASVLIHADCAAVWDAVHSPETAPIESARACYSGYVPGTPQCEAGEMQYHINRRADGHLTGHIVVVTEMSSRRNALTHTLGPRPVEQRYELTSESESGPTRLDLMCRWPAPTPTAAAESARSQMAEVMESMANGYKSQIEKASEQEPGT